MKKISRIISTILFIIFFSLAFYFQKTVAIKYRSQYYPVLTYTRSIEDLLKSINEPQLQWHLTEYDKDQKLTDGQIINVTFPWLKSP
jgi:hypothetical protein